MIQWCIVPSISGCYIKLSKEYPHHAANPYPPLFPRRSSRHAGELEPGCGGRKRPPPNRAALPCRLPSPSLLPRASVVWPRQREPSIGLYILHPNNIGRCGHLSNASYAVKKGQRGLHIGEKLVRHSLQKGRGLGAFACCSSMQWSPPIPPPSVSMRSWALSGWEIFPGDFAMQPENMRIFGCSITRYRMRKESYLSKSGRENQLFRLFLIGRFPPAVFFMWQPDFPLSAPGK